MRVKEVDDFLWHIRTFDFVAKILVCLMLPWCRCNSQHGWDLSIWKVAWDSDLYDNHNCALCHNVSHHELFAKMPSLLLIIQIAILQILPKIHEHLMWGSKQKPFEKLTAFWRLKAPISWTRNDKVDIILHLLKQSMYQSVSSILHHLWMPPPAPSTFSPAEVYCCWSATYTDISCWLFWELTECLE